MAEKTEEKKMNPQEQRYEELVDAVAGGELIEHLFGIGGTVQPY